MEQPEIGRRRPLHRRVAPKEESAVSSPIYVSFEETPDLSTLKNRYHQNKGCTCKKEDKGLKNPKENPNKVLPLIEIDLHIYELVDSIVGMDNFTMVQYQLDAVRKAMKTHSRRIGQKIVFIHGKGDGVLRKEVRSLLAKEYASCDVQDASFLKYGFGATQVTIRKQ